MRNKARLLSLVFFSTCFLFSEPTLSFELSLPLDCSLGSDCFVQKYVDIDPTKNIHIANCSRAADDAHNGTDFRVLNTSIFKNVVAAAPGKVKAVRDGIPDRLITNADQRAQVKNIECGNGVVVEHEEGWETQYCHLRNGSLQVAVGERVEREQVLGLVGYSGLAAFSHVHFSVRRDGKIVDPFLGSVRAAQSQLNSCLTGEAETESDFSANLWTVDVDSLLLHADGAIVETGFTDQAVNGRNLEVGGLVKSPSRNTALVFFARLINLKKNDRVALTVSGPGGFLVKSTSDPLNRQKAQWVSFAGRKAQPEGWPAGEYQGTVALIRSGVEVDRERSVFILK